MKRAWLIVMGLVVVAAMIGTGLLVVKKMKAKGPTVIWSVSLVPLSDTIRLERELQAQLEAGDVPVEFVQKTALGHMGDLENILVQADGAADLVVAVGADAAQMAYEAVTRKPVVCCRVPYPEKYGVLEPREMASLFAVLGETSPADLYIEELKKLKDKWGEAGVILPKGYPAGEAECEEFRSAYTSAFGSEVKVVMLDARTCAQLMDVVAVYNMIRSQKVDLYYAINDGNIAKYLGVVVDQCRAGHIPVIAGGQGVLEAGGIMTIDPDVEVVGRRCAEVVKRVLAGEPVQNETVNAFKVRKNDRVLRKMKLGAKTDE